MPLTLADIERLFEEHGRIEYDGDGTSLIEHSLQTALQAERENAGDELVAAALLHDLGHLLNRQGDTPSARGIDDQHQYFAIPFLRGVFGPAVIEPIRLHVDAKRALCVLEPAYYDALTDDSKRSLELQGGVFTREQTDAFLSKPFAHDAMRLRRWDDGAKVSGASTPPLRHFLEAVARAAARN